MSMADVAQGNDSLPLARWQWVFGVVAPILVVLADLKLFGGFVLGRAPVTIWLGAFLGPAALLQSQRPMKIPSGDVLTGALLACAVLAALATVAPIAILLMPIGDLGYRGMFAMLLDVAFLALGASLFLWPVALCARAFWVQARRRADLTRPRAPIAVSAILTLTLAASLEYVDRWYFGRALAKAESASSTEIIEGLAALQYYPLAATARTDDVCYAVYNMHDSFLQEAELEEAFKRRAGPDAGLLRSALAKTLRTAEPTRLCTQELAD